MASSVITQEEQPISRTYQYRKVMKPMLERKRRARINRCLDELKELLVGALQAEGESVSRLEKADVLELTVRHLHKLRRSHQLSENVAADRFRAGFSHCANEVAKYVSTVPSAMDVTISARLLNHLDGCLRPTNQVQVVDPPNGGFSPTQNHGPQPQRSSPRLVITNYNTPPSSPQGSSVMSPVGYNKPSPAHAQAAFWPMTYAHPKHEVNDLEMMHSEEPFDLSSGSVWRPW